MKYFVLSDPHGCKDIMVNELHSKGFVEGSEDMRLIICGDIFDRGTQTTEMYEYLKGLDDQLVFVRGNYEDGLEECYMQFRENGEVEWYHQHNGTVKTMMVLLNNGLLDEVIDWINNKTIDYFETEHYIFVHGFIPTISYNKFYPDWRNATKKDWMDARWTNGMDAYFHIKKDLDKTIVCGHRCCGYGNLLYHGEITDDLGEDTIIELSDHPFIENHLIAIDSCTAYSGKVNVFSYRRLI